MRRMILQTLLTTCGISAVGLLNSVVLSRWLGPAGRGDIAAAMLWPGLLIYLGSMGLIIATMYFASLPQAKPSLVLGNAVVLGIVLSAGAAIVGYVALPWLLKSQSSTVIAGSRLYLLVIPLSLITQFGTSVLQGRLKMSAVNRLRMIIPIGYLIGTLSFIALDGLTLFNILILHLSLNILTLICTFILLGRAGIYPAAKFDTGLSRQLLTYGTKVHVGQISGFANVSLDQMLLAAWFPSSYLGLYMIAVNTAGMSQVLSQAVQTVATPKIAQEESEAERGTVLQNVFRQYWLFSILIMLAMGVALPFLIPAIFGVRFKPAVWPAEILLLGSCFMGAKQVLAGAAHALGDPWLCSKANLCALVVTLVLLCVLLPVLGITGAAIASTAAYFAELSVVVYGLYRTHLISPRGLFRLRFRESKSLLESMLVELRRNRLDYTPN